MPDRGAAQPADLELPPNGLPRPGDDVTVYEHSRRLTGTLRGHRHNGRPIVESPLEGSADVSSFDCIRLTNAEDALPPNWHRLPDGAGMHMATQQEVTAFDALLAERTPPGPRYRDLIDEIYLRGFEVFVVGGTVRDLLQGLPGRDVDLVTTMPLAKAQHVLRQMYGSRAVEDPLPAAACRNGHLRLGGRLGTSDPFIDFCTFKQASIGSSAASFGDSFKRDTENRDFACNAVYYDPVNRVLLDPSGRGVTDAERGLLTIVANGNIRSPYQLGQLVIRFFKFVGRGMTPGVGELDKLVTLVPNLASMDVIRRAKYVRGQVVDKAAPDRRSEEYTRFRDSWVDLGFEADFVKYVECERELILRGSP